MSLNGLFVCMECRCIRKRLLEFVERNKLKSSTIYTFNALNEMEGILQFGDMMSANMIAMATHGRKGISHLYYGSITEDVINHAPNLIWTYAIRNHEKIQVDEKLEEHHYQ